MQPAKQVLEHQRQRRGTQQFSKAAYQDRGVPSVARHRLWQCVGRIHAEPALFGSIDSILPVFENGNQECALEQTLNFFGSTRFNLHQFATVPLQGENPTAERDKPKGFLPHPDQEQLQAPDLGRTAGSLHEGFLNGCGSKSDRSGKPLVLVFASIYKGAILATTLQSHSQMETEHFWIFGT